MQLPTPEFKVLLFGPELPTAGLRALARFEDGVLVVEGAGHWYTAEAADLAMKTGGFDGRQWIVYWNSPRGGFSAMLQSDAAMDTFVDQAPVELAPQLHQVRKKHRHTGHRFRLALGMLGLALFFPVFALVWFWLNADNFSRWAADKVSVAQEIELGEQAFAQMRPQLKLLPEQALADQVVDRLGVRLSAGSVYPFKFHVVQDDQVNAFALPGGHVVVFTGLLKAADGSDEVAGVLAHEISHVTLRHSLRAMLHSVGLRAILAVALDNFGAGLWGGILGDVAGDLGELSFSRDQEREADLEAVRLLAQAGLSAGGLLTFFEKMAVEEDFGINILSTHPSSPERMDALRAAIQAQGQYPYQCLYSDWDAVREKL